MAKLSYKVSYYVLYVMFAAILVVWACSTSVEMLKAMQYL